MKRQSLTNTVSATSIRLDHEEPPADASLPLAEGNRVLESIGRQEGLSALLAFSGLHEQIRRRHLTAGSLPAGGPVSNRALLPRRSAATDLRSRTVPYSRRWRDGRHARRIGLCMSRGSRFTAASPRYSICTGNRSFCASAWYRAELFAATTRKPTAASILTSLKRSERGRRSSFPCVDIATRSGCSRLFQLPHGLSPTRTFAASSCSPS